MPRQTLGPNSLLRRARLARVSPTGSGLPLSRQELAEAINAHLWARSQRVTALDGRYIGKLERGEHRWPQVDYREALRTILNAPTDAVLGFYATRQQTERPSRFSGSGGGQSDGHSFASVNHYHHVPEEVLIIMSGEESARHAEAAQASNTREEQLQRWQIELSSLAVDILHAPILGIVARLCRLRDEAFGKLDGRQSPRHSMRLYAIAAWACGMLAGTASDRFARYDAAERHGEAAAICAQHSEDHQLQAWIASVRAGVAFWRGHYRACAQLAHHARRALPPGIEFARLATVEARAWAALGDHAAMRAALDAAQDFRDRGEPAIGPGVMAFPLANQIRLAGSAYLRVGDHAQAVVQLNQALTLLTTDYPSAAHIAAARGDLALAYLKADAVDGALDALAPMLEAPSKPGTHLVGAARRARQVTHILTQPQFAAIPSVRQFVTDIEGFIAAQHGDGGIPASVVSSPQVPA